MKKNFLVLKIAVWIFYQGIDLDNFLTITCFSSSRCFVSFKVSVQTYCYIYYKLDVYQNLQCYVYNAFVVMWFLKLDVFCSYEIFKQTTPNILIYLLFTLIYRGSTVAYSGVYY